MFGLIVAMQSLPQETNLQIATAVSAGIGLVYPWNAKVSSAGGRRAGRRGGLTKITKSATVFLGAPFLGECRGRGPRGGGAELAADVSANRRHVGAPTPPGRL